ncbi:NADH:flavin oxidoreductase [uncultured Clostridium sp.]|jgi:2,4-dienoyl-CoA reductase-like NADH-dependent reductase (Old Yellow Enzyme family)|uniref:NADH:flavin oxidoreductase n=1 Tax=uncultured Clostridium sp. TaxID=59620 RepID=UPI00262AF52B|nr:NADH:flavin oxidoreductase [uncultured Clostridium sp.]
MNRLFEKTNLLGFETKNRFVRTATWENYATKDGHMTDKLFGIYENLAKNEVGTIITGYVNIVKEEQPNAGMMGMYDDSFISEYKKLTSMCHEYDSKIILQLAYGGTKTTFNVGERIIFAPSIIAELSTGTVGVEMTKDDIEYIVNGFASSARRAKESGFDGVEIHGAHTYLINQFLSPYYNRRSDEYGGSLLNRFRFLKEIYLKVREEVDHDFSILVKLTASDFFDGGLTFEETKKVCTMLEEIGVNALEISGNVHGKARGLVGEVFDGQSIEKEGYFINYAKEIKKIVSIPIITVGGFTSFTGIEEKLNDTGIDYFGLSRPLISEPDLIKQWKENGDKKARCVRCSKCRTSEGNYCTIFDKDFNFRK